MIFKQPKDNPIIPKHIITMSQKEKVVAKPPAFAVNKFDIEKFSVTLTPEAVQKQDSAKKPKMPYYAIPKYKYSVKAKEDGKDVVKEQIAQPVCMTGDIKLVAYGIPTNPKGEGVEPFYATEKDRSFFRIPLDPEQPACVELMEMINSLDEYMADEENRSELFAGLPKDRLTACEYSPLNKEPSEKMKEPRYNSLKVHLDVDFDSGDIMTPVFIKQPNGKNEPQQITTLKDVEKYFRWGCTFRCAIMIQKMWVMKGKNTSKKYPYGLGAKCMQIIIKEPGAGGNSTKEAYRTFMFEDEGEVETSDVPAAPASKKETVVEKKQSAKESVDDEEDASTKTPTPKKVMPPKKSPPKKESSDEEESDEEPKKKTPPKKSPPKKESSDEEESDEEPKKKTPPKKESSDEEESDEEPKAKSKAAKKPVKPAKSKKQSKESSDEEDEDD